jgi:hypothetical protein
MRLHLSAMPGSKSVELLISWIAITNAMNRPTLIGVCWNSPPNRTSAEAACVMPRPRTSSAVRTNPKERRSSGRGAPMRHEVALGRERFILCVRAAQHLRKSSATGENQGRAWAYCSFV